MIEYSGTNTYSNISKAIVESESVNKVLEGNLGTLPIDAAFEIIMMGTARARRWRLTRCGMYTPTAMWQDSIKKVIDNNKAMKELDSMEAAKVAEAEKLALQLDSLPSAAQPSAEMTKTLKRMSATVDLSKYENADWVPKEKSSLLGGMANKAKAGAKAVKNAIVGTKKASPMD